MNTTIKFVAGSCLVLLNLACAYVVRAQSGPLDNDPSLKLHLDFDEDFSGGEVLDVSSNGNNGWQMDATNWITATNGVFGTTAGQFTYVGQIYSDPPRVHEYSQYIAVTNVNGFYYLTNATISVWAKFGSNSDISMYLLSAGYPQMYAFDTNAAINSWTFNRDNNSYLSFITYPLGVYKRDVLSWPDNTIQPGGYTPILATTNFDLYTVTINCPSNIAIAYYDGRPYMTNTIDLPWIRVYGTINEPWLCIGAMGHDGTPQWGDDAYPNAGFFVGEMDDLRIYNRTLSAAEVQDLYFGYGSPAWNTALTITNSGAHSVQLRFNGISNVLYQVEFNTNLLSGTWTTLTSAIAGTNGPISVPISTTTDASVFYRVHPLP